MIERIGRTRADVFVAAVELATAAGAVWNDLSGKERDAYVQGIERKWQDAEDALVAKLAKQLGGPDAWTNLPFAEKAARLVALDASSVGKATPVSGDNT